MTPAESQAIHIAQSRQLLNPSPVRHGHVPNWLRLRILKRIGCHDRDTAGAAVLGVAVSGHNYILDYWLDHWGSTNHRGRTAFVTEPYNGTPDVLEAAARFAERLGIKWHVCANSWWYPGWTVRILFYEPEANQ
jgi:hypothetical protein